jgi:hypothetical protein
MSVAKSGKEHAQLELGIRFERMEQADQPD